MTCKMGEHACKDPSQCWEPCGQLGNDERFVKRGVECNCGRDYDQVLEKGHIMGCNLRTRLEAVRYHEYEQSLQRVTDRLNNFDRML